MSAENPTARSLFLEAVEKLPSDQWPQFVETASAGDTTLCAEVLRLLDAHAEAGSFMAQPAVERAVEQPRAGDDPAAAAADLAGWVERAAGEICGFDIQATQAHAESLADVSLEFLSPPEKPGQLGRLDHYEILEVIGHGGMGVVLKAFDQRLHRMVAVKVMAPQLASSGSARKRFVREAQAAAAVRDEHVIDIYAVGEANGLPYLAMEYIAGDSLQDRLNRGGPLELKEILRVGRQIAAGLAAVHAQGLIHRDIKPANILLEDSVQRVKITDFGLARAVDDVSLTQSGIVAGTPQYMAPEQAKGVAVDHRADLFSLGSVLYAMSSGRPPFRASTTLAVLARVANDLPRPIQELNPDIPDWLVAIIGKLHAKDPAERFQSAAEVAELLGQHLARLQQPSIAPLPSTASPAPVAASPLSPGGRGAGGEGAGGEGTGGEGAGLLPSPLAGEGSG